MKHLYEFPALFYGYVYPIQTFGPVETFKTTIALESRGVLECCK